MRIRIVMLLFFVLNVSFEAFCQDNGLYYIFLTDKVHEGFCPEEQFSERSIERRLRQEIPWEETDWPISTPYVNRIGEEVNRIRYRLKWLNAVTVEATAEQIDVVAGLPFIKRIEAFGQAGFTPVRVENPDRGRAPEKDPELDTLITLQRQQMQANLLRNAGLTGEGVRIAVIDVGFKNVETHPALKHLVENEKLIASRNFYRSGKTVFAHDEHGLGVLGCIAGKYDDRWIGMAPDAEFLLARTEHRIWEKSIEEDHWLAAAEWADSMGADIINSSLGYHKRYDYEVLNGKTTLVSKAAALAAQKGMLVITSAGNEGINKWQYITAPADVPEVLAVGGTLPFLPYRIRFSSYGPNSEGVKKPNVSAPAYVVIPTKKGKYRVGQGTSFAGPLVAGFAACVMQKYPEKSAQEIFELIEKAGHLYPYYDYSHGHGVPQAGKLFATDDTLRHASFTADFQQGKVSLKFDPAIVADSINHPYGRVLYYHFENPDGTLDSYEHIMVPTGARGYQFQYHHQTEGVLRIWYAGTLLEK